MTVRITYDAEANAAYISVSDEIPAGAASEQIHSITPPSGRGEIVLDFDDAGRLLGVEILGARELIDAAVLGSASAP